MFSNLPTIMITVQWFFFKLINNGTLTVAYLLFSWSSLHVLLPASSIIFSSSVNTSNGNGCFPATSWNLDHGMDCWDKSPPHFWLKCRLLNSGSSLVNEWCLGMCLHVAHVLEKLYLKSLVDFSNYNCK